MSARGRWLALFAAAAGWFFDGLEMGLFPLVARRALGELCGPNAIEADIARWYSIITAAFLIGAATGGALFGWLGDLYGRTRIMIISILVYSFASGLSAFATAPWQLAAFRYFGALGMGGEWALGVALIMEIWPDKSRIGLAAVIGAAGNLGFTACALIALGLNHSPDALRVFLLDCGLTDSIVNWLTRNHQWRLLLLTGTAPALLTFFIRLWVPESDRWNRQATHPLSGKPIYVMSIMMGSSLAVGLVYFLDSTDVRYLSILIAVPMLACIAGLFSMPALGLSNSIVRNSNRITSRLMLGVGLSAIPLLGTWSTMMWLYPWVGTLPGGNHPDAVPTCQAASSIGAAIGAVIGAMLNNWIPRRVLFAVLCLSSLGIVQYVYLLHSQFDRSLIVSAFAMGLITSTFYGWLPLYLPELFPTAVRASGQGFSFNFARILAAVGNLQMPLLLKSFDGNYASACSAMSFVYLFGIIIIMFAPETRHRPLPE